MNFGKVTLTVCVLTLALVAPRILEAEEEKDFAVPAFSDLAVTGTPSTAPEMRAPNLVAKQLEPLLYMKQLQWLDINRDFQLNDFDVKQFQAIIESLNGEKLSGLQITIRFREAQKNQRESFPLLYDLDRDGMFTSFDVDRFTQVINKLDAGATRGNELIHKFRLQIFPPNHHDQR